MTTSEVQSGGGVCGFCGTPLKTLPNAVSARCMICGERGRTRTWCTQGHYVCQQCRGNELLALVEGLLQQAQTDDPVELFIGLRRSRPFPMHGSEHHALVAAAFLVAYHRRHGEPSWPAIMDALQTAATELPGGTCGFWGACSAGLAVGIACCTILDSSPTDGAPRAAAHQIVSQILARIARYPGPRCCRRECLLALQTGCELSATLLPRPLSTTYTLPCEQAEANDECYGSECPFL